MEETFKQENGYLIIFKFYVKSSDMKYFIVFLFSVPSILFAQNTITSSIMHDDLEREYILYVPASYDGSAAVPLILNYHGFGSNAEQQMFYGDFRGLADSLGFLVVHPLGTPLQGNNHWNVGGWTVGSTVDDVGFTGALLDTLIENYSIDEQRIYSTGMSNGGFMSYLLACQMSDRIAAIASVTGSMTPETYDNCNAKRPVPVLEIHGTSDEVVNYDGTFFAKPIPTVIEYWVSHNNNNATAELIEIENTVLEDYSMVEHYIYKEGDKGARVEHMKVLGGAHTWPGSAIPFQGTNMDINASTEIWKFFSNYTLDGSVVHNVDQHIQQLELFPNPASTSIHVSYDKKASYRILNQLGQLTMNGEMDKSNSTIDVSNLKNGLYYIQIDDTISKFLIVKE